MISIMRTDRPHPCQRRRLGRHGAALVLLIAAGTGAFAQAAQDAVVFPDVTVSRRHGLDPGTDLRRRDIEPLLDLFYSGDFGRWRVLGEVSLSEDEREIERLQLGWLLDADNTLWLGRFHNPLGYWNTQFHHGTYLQTSISRPGIHEHEHEDGALPTQLAGALWEGAYARDGAEGRYAAALGAGPGGWGGGGGGGRGAAGPPRPRKHLPPRRGPPGAERARAARVRAARARRG